jgi:DNA-binding CsgD family transcriptional regulator
MYTFELKPDIRQSSLSPDLVRPLAIREGQVPAAKSNTLPLIKDVLAYYEPDTSEFHTSEPLSNAFHAIFILDGIDRVRRKNYLAEELLDDRQLFRITNGHLVPFLDSELPYWERQLNAVRKSGKPRFAILAGLHNRFAVGLSVRSQGDIEVHIETGLKIREEVLQVFCDSTGITGSEKEVLRWVLVGLKPKAIAHIRSRSEATVRSHVKNALAKSGCSSVPELIAMVTRLPDFA